MIRTCVTCRQPTVVAHEIDGAPRIVDPTPVDDGPLVLLGDLTDQPTALWGINPGDTLPDSTPTAVDTTRYQPHTCPKE